jgi:hypothetical protein
MLFSIQVPAFFISTDFHVSFYLVAFFSPILNTLTHSRHYHLIHTFQLVIIFTAISPFCCGGTMSHSRSYFIPIHCLKTSTCEI